MKVKIFIKKIYLIIPDFIKKYLFLFLKKIYKPKSKHYQHLYFKGFFKENFMKKSFYVYSLPTIIENTVFWEGIEKGYEPLSLKCWYFISKNSKIVLDIGSNTGLFILISHAANKNSIKYSFDPSKNFVYAQKKIKKKNNINLIINNFALGDYEGEINFDGYQVHRENNFKSTNIVKIRKLSNYLNENNICIENIDSIKIDVEHFEYFILKDIIEIIKNKMPNIILEILSDEEAKQIHYILKDLNYSIYLIDDKNFKIKKIYKIEKSLYRNILLLNNKYENQFNSEFKYYLK